MFTQVFTGSVELWTGRTLRTLALFSLLALMASKLLGASELPPPPQRDIAEEAELSWPEPEGAVCYAKVGEDRALEEVVVSPEVWRKWNERLQVDADVERVQVSFQASMDTEFPPTASPYSAEVTVALNQNLGAFRTDLPRIASISGFVRVPLGHATSARARFGSLAAPRPR